MTALQDAINGVKRKYPHLKRLDETIGLVGSALQGKPDLQLSVFGAASSIGDSGARVIDEAMNTDVGFVGRLSGSQNSRDLARLAVLVQAVLIDMGNKGTSDFSALTGMARPLASGKEAVAREAVTSRLALIESIHAKEKARLQAELDRVAEEAERARRAAADEQARRKSANKLLAEAAMAEQRRRITVRESANLRYLDTVKDIAKDRQAQRGRLESFSNTFVLDIVSRYLSSATIMDKAVKDVEDTLASAMRGAEQRAKFKRELATSLFKAIRQYAPPPFNLAGALVEAGINIALNIYNEASKAAILADTKLSVDGAELGKKALDFMQEKITGRIKAQNIPSMSAVDGDTTVADMLNKARLEATTMVSEAVERVLKEEGMALTGGSETADYSHQQDIVQKRVKFDDVAGAPAASSPSAPRPLAVGRSDFLTKLDRRLRQAKDDEYQIFLRMTDQLRNVARLSAPAPNTSGDFKIFTYIFIYAVAMKGRVEANKASGIRDIPKLEKEEIAFLKKIGLISTDKADDQSNTLPIYYKEGSNTSSYVLVATMLNFANADNNPFAAVFSSKADPIAAMKRGFEEMYRLNKAIGENVRTQAEISSNRSFAQTATGFKQETFTKKLYG